MDVFRLSTDVLPPPQRLPIYQQSTIDYEVDSPDNPLRFHSRATLIKLGDLNLVENWMTRIRYTRDNARIAADGRDRFSFTCMIAGHAAGTIGDRAIDLDPGDIMVLDLSRPMKVATLTPTQAFVITLPRFMVEEALPDLRFHGVLKASPATALAMDLARSILDTAETLPASSAALYGRAMRDALAAAVAGHGAQDDESEWRDDVARRAAAFIDARLDQAVDGTTLAAELNLVPSALDRALASAGGLGQLVLRRRLLATYRALDDPTDTRTIAAIAQDCGFNSPSQFNRAVRRAFGVSARDLRGRAAPKAERWVGVDRIEDDYAPLLKETP